ncbi:hypothetical protein BDV39DRAFT_41399 [Aspergillus sergii]|uniref:Uncharacterized protein n=1 Tax=Aspergillus sergii TaxID=1034303 RepID=A0A5N6WJN2_9EURO|nr:hypothetical protein BDV39DRAFT_41399 [Aspergillus sergii]
MSGLAKSRYVLSLTCLILDFDEEKGKKKRPSLQEVPSQQPIHTWTTTTTDAFHSPSVPFSTKYTPGTVQFSSLSYHCRICISISSFLCFLLDQTSHAPQLIHLELEKEPPLGDFSMHPWQQRKVLVGTRPTSDRLGQSDRLEPTASMLGYMAISTLIKQTTAGGESPLLQYPVRGPVHAGRSTSPRH